tara:strand:- start:97 stop:1104 length:1008 start_codon:yes stop_codon:yes gene_type:complete
MDKFHKLKHQLSASYKKEIITNLSPASGYRSRCEFGYKNGFYTMVKDGKKVFLDHYDLPVSAIQNIMKPLLSQININPLINKKLFQINFRAVNQVILVTLIYHKPLNQCWLEAAKMIENKLPINVIGRSKKQLLASNLTELEDYIDINPSYYLYQNDKTFYQPNAFLMPKMVQLVISLIKNPRDLLELYCGSGTFTIPLSYTFNNIFATENNRDSISYLKKSISKNDIENIYYARLSDIELMDALKGRIFRRLEDVDLENFDFSHILVDPPRSGLSNNITEILNKFDNIIYISCNPDTFQRDLDNLKDYKIEKLEVFDQFSNTPHIELIALLIKH